ncbi:MAG: HDIG domain-containing protein [Bacteroidales bacterium]|nr:HDIG domain-containing protein [Bacteroidales bacterium]
MKKFFLFIRNQYQHIFKGFLFILAIAILVWIFPKEGKFKYEFSQGKPWLHEDMYAPFDFAIDKSAEDIAAEKDEAILGLPFYFRYVSTDSLLTTVQLEPEFIRLWEVSVQDSLDNAGYRQHNLEVFLRIHNELAERGILVMVPEIENLTPEYPIIIVRDNIAEEYDFEDLLTLNKAYGLIQQQLALKNDVERELLASLIVRFLPQNMVYDAEKTAMERDAVIAAISPTFGLVQDGERIISKGEVVNDARFIVLNSLKSNYEENLGGSETFYAILLGQVLIIAIAITVLLLFFIYFRRDILIDNRNIVLILLVIILITLLTSLTVSFSPAFLYIVPVCLVPIVISAFFDTRMALYVYLITIIILGFLVPNSFEFVFLQLMAGTIAIMNVANLQRRGQFFITSVWIFATYSVLYVGLTLIQYGTIWEIDPLMFAMFGGSAVLTLFSYPLIYIFEKIFGFITDVTLVELSNTNNKLLRELSLKAPGTFQHSLQVANLAEDAIYEIGGNALMVRTGAMYHDIGKMDMPMYFVENQSTGVNPHDDLTNEESARIIISHVIKGVEKAKRHKLPEQIIDFIRTHHGTRKVEYFYTLYKKETPEDEVDKSEFTYPGPIPFSRETAVVMMADSVEAASRSLKEHKPQNINELVENIINRQVDTNQFINADITFKDITRIKKIFKKKLMTIYHVRIEYPEMSA